jgi:molybdate transport system ATP-binding protein
VNSHRADIGQLEVRLVKRLSGFTLDAKWRAGDEVVALFGPSGAGKTLTLQCLAGLMRPDEGRIVVKGTVFFDAAARVDLPTQKRRLGYVFQGHALFPHLSVADNVAYGLHDWPRDRRRRRTTEILERLGLGDLASRRPSELSGGQRQRVALGRALAPDPELLLLDEPLSALDAPLRRQLREELLAVVREWRKTTILVTHDLPEAFQLADRVVVYEAGQVVQQAPKSELLSAPASERVARLMGVRNILSGRVLKAMPDRIQLRWRGQTLEAVNSPIHSYLPEPGAPLSFYIRPEYVRLIRKDQAPADAAHHMNLMAGRVVGETDFGPTWTLHFKLDEPGRAAQGDHDLEIEVPRMVYEILDIARDRHWRLSIHRGSIHVLPS